MAKRFGLADLAEARAYLAHRVLGQRLRDCVRLMLGKAGHSAREILGYPDDLKFCSSLTLFAQAAESEVERALFAEGLKAFYGGKADPLTLSILAGN